MASIVFGNESNFDGSTLHTCWVVAAISSDPVIKVQFKFNFKFDSYQGGLQKH